MRARTNRLSFPLVLAGTLLLVGEGCAGAHKKESVGRGKIIVQQTVDPSGGFPIEGTISHVRIEKLGGGTGIDKRLRYDRATKQWRATIRLTLGSYTLSSYQRICDANCGNLDPASHKCSGRFTIGQKPEHADIRVTFGSGCKIEFSE